MRQPGLPVPGTSTPIPDIDLCEFHDYTPKESIPGDQWNGLGVRVQQCAALGKPLFVGEAGIRPIDAGGSLQDRATAFRAKFAAQTNVGIDGVLAWDYSPTGSTLNNYDIGPNDPMLREMSLRAEEFRELFKVNTTDDLDDGTCDQTHCSLREAMTIANYNATNNQMPEVVAFDIPGPGPYGSPEYAVARDHRPRDDRWHITTRIFGREPRHRTQRHAWTDRQRFTHLRDRRDGPRTR